MVNYSSLSVGTGRAMDRVRRGWARAWGANPGRRHLMAKPTIAFVGLSGGETVEGQSPVATIVNTWLTPTLTDWGPHGKEGRQSTVVS